MRLLMFIETDYFSKVIKELFDDDEYFEIQYQLLLNPTKGKLIQGTGGLRKVRFGHADSGQRGGVRLIYYYADGHGRIYLIAVYPKSKKDDLSSAEKAVFKRLIDTLKRELDNG